MFRIILAYLFIATSVVQASQCRKIDNTYNCGGKGIYRRIGNRVFGPKNEQYLIQGKRIYGPNNVTYTRIGNRVFKDNKTSFAKQGSFIQRNDGKNIVVNDKLYLGEIDEDFVPVEVLLEE